MDTGGSDKVDALEDKTEKFLWQWELREQKSLPKAHRAAAGQHKKQMQKVMLLQNYRMQHLAAYICNAFPQGQQSFLAPCRIDYPLACSRSQHD